MKQILTQRIGPVVLALGMLAMIGCSAGDETELSSGLVVEVMDSVAAAVAENIIDSQPSPVGPVEAIDLAARTERTDGGLPPINDLLVEGTRAYAGFDGGLLVYDLKSDEFTVSPLPEDVRAVERHGGEMFIGAEELYQLAGVELIGIEEELPGQITAMCSYGPSLMIGTTEGLYARNVLGLTSLLEEVEISALVEGRKGLWVGTAEKGIYLYDGESFQKRFLKRDSSLFDRVTALAYNHDRLYLGTPHGMFVYDGGSWETVSVEEGLPTNEITTIDASGWVVLVGTTSGLASYFNDEVDQVDRMDGYVISAVARCGKKLIAGTGSNGIILKTGPSVKTLVEPWETVDDLAMIM